MSNKPIIEMKDITKSFPGVKALNGVNLKVLPGEIHVLLGENGAGKSTLMKILSGVYTPDSGEIIIDGEVFNKLTPKISTEHGISVIYQELSVVNWLSIRENIFMGNLPIKKMLGIKCVDYKKMNERTTQLLKKINND